MSIKNEQANSGKLTPTSCIYYSEEHIISLMLDTSLQVQER